MRGNCGKSNGDRKFIIVRGKLTSVDVSCNIVYNTVNIVEQKHCKCARTPINSKKKGKNNRKLKYTLIWENINTICLRYTLKESHENLLSFELR